MPETTTIDVGADDALAFRLAAHGLDRRRPDPSDASLAAAAHTALPDYPKGAAERSLAARCADLPAGTLHGAVASGVLVRGLSLRGTTHVVAADDASVAAHTTGVLPTPGDETAAQAVLGSSWPVFEALGVTAVEALDGVAGTLAGIGADGRPRTKGGFSEALHDRLPDGWEPWCQRCAAHHVPDLLFRVAAVAAGLRFVDGGNEMAAGPRPLPADHAAARAELVRRFLAAYAPAPPQAFAEWSGLGAAEAGASFAALGEESLPVRLDGRAARALAADVPRLSSSSAAPTDVDRLRLVPAGDPFLQQRDRATLVPDADRRRRLWRPAGAPGLVLVDGRPAGTWRHKQDRGGLLVTVEPWSEAAVSGDELHAEAAAVLSSPKDRIRVAIGGG